ncbi:MAG: nicotinamide riboside transporter PnuC [Bacillota bacterium]
MAVLFDIDYVLLTIWDYPLSLAELLGTLFGLWSVWLAARGRVANYPVGLVNILFFFVIFYQVQMYSDVLLQVYFFIVSLYGWWRWARPRPHEATATHELKISTNSPAANLAGLVLIALGVYGLGTLMRSIHLLLPALFPEPAAFPYYDAFTTVASMAAMYLLARKRLESWVLWVVVDAFCIVLYYLKGIRLISLEYVVFLFIAAFGLWSWLREYRSYQRPAALAGGVAR